MFIRIPLRPTFFTKKPRAVLLNFKRLDRCKLGNKKIEFFQGYNRFVVGFPTHEEAQTQFNRLEEPLTKPQGERWDTASVDPLAMAALEDYKPELK